MKTNKLIWTLGWITMGSLAALQGCGGDDDDGGDGSGGEAGDGTGGSTGGSATGGRGGSTGGSATGGRGGSTGGTTQGGAGGAPGGMGGEDTGGGGEAGGGTVDAVKVAACGQYCGSYFLNMCETFDTDSYGDLEGCQSACEGSDWEVGMPGVAGDTVMCRLSHADLAVAGASREMHCGHASENSTGVCVP